MVRNGGFTGEVDLNDIFGLFLVQSGQDKGERLVAGGFVRRGAGSMGVGGQGPILRGYKGGRIKRGQS